jgi:hypothetical protein
MKLSRNEKILRRAKRDARTIRNLRSRCLRAGLVVEVTCDRRARSKDNPEFNFSVTIKDDVYAGTRWQFCMSTFCGCTRPLHTTLAWRWSRSIDMRRLSFAGMRQSLFGWLAYAEDRNAIRSGRAFDPSI